MKEDQLLSGSLAVFQAQEVLQWMMHYPGEGILSFEIPIDQYAEPYRLELHLRRGEVLALHEGSPVRAAQSAPTLQPHLGRLGALLVEKELIAPGELRYGLGLQEIVRRRQESSPLGEVLMTLGFLDAEALDGALRDLALRKLAGLLSQASGRFSFRRGSLPPPALPVGQRLDHLLLRVAHLADQIGAEQLERERQEQF